MNRTNFDFLHAIFVNCNFEELTILVVNQTTQNKLLESDYSNVKVINSFEKGLSKSRNLGLRNATRNLLVLTDDDVVYKSNFVRDIIESFNKFQSSAIQFRIENFAGELHKKYPKSPKLNCNSFNCLNMMSIELVFEKDFLISNEIQFDENFGLGSTHVFGEENIILHDILKKNGLISFQPFTIAQHKNQTSTDILTNQEKYYHLGAFYYRIDKNKFLKNIHVKLVFDLKQKKVMFKETISLLKIAHKGKLNYAK